MFFLVLFCLVLGYTYILLGAKVRKNNENQNENQN